MAASRLLLLVVLLAPAGCLTLAGGSQETSFYLLTSLASRDPHALTQAAPDGVAVGVGPIEIAPHLNRPQIVTRTRDNRMVLAEFHKWGEPLRDNLTRVLAENLSVLLDTQRVAVYPWPRSAPLDFRLRGEIKRFAAGSDGSVQLRCHWTLADAAGRPLRTQVSSVGAPLADDDYDSIVAGMSRLLEELGREMAAAVRESR